MKEHPERTIDDPRASNLERTRLDLKHISQHRNPRIYTGSAGSKPERRILSSQTSAETTEKHREERRDIRAGGLRRRHDQEEDAAVAEARRFDGSFSFRREKRERKGKLERERLIHVCLTLSRLLGSNQTSYSHHTSFELRLRGGGLSGGGSLFIIC
ncbi:hypothetical protein DY000_02003011 [Brassica cretica]|uniref:Uncharacterized protein n=1 Tax=Brassica cretica TaxID=69181 RepID=A0ABQ7BYZ2_BRACR|nr:hypothetical protein DY000_02003011 [Brassica cretica]